MVFFVLILFNPRVATNMSIRYFETANHVNLYSKFRPILPQQVLDFVLNYLSECIDSKEWNIMVDVGCGSGQSTNNLSNFFRHVYGFDVSPEQIREANKTKHPNNVYYNVSHS
jgi:trans-aconitate methyltransferase